MNEQFREMFVEEAGEQIAEFEAAVLRLEHAAGDADAIDVLFRLAHSLKGSSSMMGFADISGFAHLLESLLERVRSGAGAATGEVIGTLLASGDVLRALVRHVEAGLDAAPDPGDLPSVAARIEALLGAAAATPQPARAPAGPGAVELPTRRASDREEATVIRVSVDKVDRLVDLVGELVTAQSMLAESAGDDAPEVLAKVREAVARMDRHVRELHHSVLAVRMVSVRTLFARFPRFVRDLVEGLGKQAALELAGEDTELDKSVIEKIGDPLLHLVRNAIDHGLERPEGRRAAGKPEIGRLRLEASQHGGSVYIEVSDDGRGLDRERILRRGRALGLVAEGEEPSDEDVFALIFRPGFSTAETISEISGRGVGMDVVKRNVEALGGSLSTWSEPGRGTRFRVQLPLTLALLEGQLLQVGDQVYILPIVAITESVRPAPDSVHALDRGAEVIVVRRETLPLIRLARLFGVPGASEDPTAGLVVLVEHEGRRSALLVDGLLGQQQVVIKSLETHFRRVDAIAGASILGDGRVALILDVAGLIALARRPGDRDAARDSAPGALVSL